MKAQVRYEVPEPVLGQTNITVSTVDWARRKVTYFAYVTSKTVATRVGHQGADSVELNLGDTLTGGRDGQWWPLVEVMAHPTVHGVEFSGRPL